MITLSRATILLAAVATMVVPRLASAQTARPLQISVAYTYLRDPSIDLTFPAGWSAGVEKGANGWLSIAAAYDESRATTPTIVGDLRSSVRTMLAGGKASTTLGRFTEFGQVLAGIAHESGSGFGATVTSSHFAAQMGAGFDYPLPGKIAARVELDFRVFGHSGEPARQIRALAGIVLTPF